MLTTRSEKRKIGAPGE
jgi:hypothetical protein